MRRSQPRRLRLNYFAPVLIAVGLVFSGACLAISSAVVPAAAHFQKAPNFNYPDLNQKKVDLAAYRGKVVLLNFWATWCGPCLLELPHFVQWQRQDGGRNLQVIGISMDDSVFPVRALYAKYQLNYPVVMGDEKLGEKYGGIFGLPVTFLIDRRGNIRFKHQGTTNLDLLHREVEKLAGER